MHEFEVMFERLSRTRRRYEELRTAKASFEQRAQLLEQLHELRAGMAEARRHLI